MGLHNPDEGIREAEERDRGIERKEEPAQERGHGQRSREPDATDNEEGEDNDGGPPASPRA